jgi:dual specificity tyrosine-phosphorylation-regulated kinase 2/3/4
MKILGKGSFAQVV